MLCLSDIRPVLGKVNLEVKKQHSGGVHTTFSLKLSSEATLDIWVISMQRLLCEGGNCILTSRKCVTLHGEKETNDFSFLFCTAVFSRPPFEWSLL